MKTTTLLFGILCFALALPLAANAQTTVFTY
jgi:hypothetical protein